MFHSFFPNPRLYFGSFAVYAIAGVLLWFFVLIGMGDTFSIGGMFGYGYPAELAAETAVKTIRDTLVGLPDIETVTLVAFDETAHAHLLNALKGNED